MSPFGGRILCFYGDVNWLRFILTPESIFRALNSTRNLLIKIGKIATALALLGYLVFSGKLDLHKFAGLADAGFAPYLGGMLFLLLVTHALMAVRQLILLRRLGSDMSWRESFSVIMVGVFFNNFAPGWSGGDLARMYYLKKETGLSLFSIGGALFVDRVLGLAGLAFIAMVSAAYMAVQGAGRMDMLWSYERLGLVCVAMGFPIFIVAMMLFLRYERVSAFFIELLRRFTPWDNAHLFTVALKAFAARRRTLLQCFALSVVMQYSAIAGISTLALYMFDASTAESTLLMAPLVLFISIVPVTPGNIGWMELMAEGILGLFDQSGGATIFAAWRVVVLFFSLAGLGFYIKKGAIENPEPQTAPPPPARP